MELKISLNEYINVIYFKNVSLYGLYMDKNEINNDDEIWDKEKSL